jgi:hypothetical protein
MLYLNALIKALQSWLLALYNLLKAFLNSCTSYNAIPLSASIYILNGKVVKGALVSRGYLFYKRQIC